MHAEHFTGKKVIFFEYAIFRSQIRHSTAAITAESARAISAIIAAGFTHTLPYRNYLQKRSLSSEKSSIPL